MPPQVPGRWHDIVRQNHHRTAGIVVAQSGDCLSIQKDELQLVPGRAFRPAHPNELEDLDLGESWFLGVLLCPHDDMADLARWAEGIPRPDLWRIRLYYTPEVDYDLATTAWTDAGLPDLSRFEVVHFQDFHKLFGRHHADVVYRDAVRARNP